MARERDVTARRPARAPPYAHTAYARRVTARDAWRFDFDCNLVVTQKILMGTHPALRFFWILSIYLIGN
jgi:hypothetical protein